MLGCGGAVITSTAEVFRETVRGHSHQVHPEDQEGWTDAMMRVIRDDDWWRHLRRGATRIAERYTSERCAAETFSLYRQVAQSRSEIAVVPGSLAGERQAA
jgi:alpha-1,3-rhamnosyl/mannosyltransferase